jgi:hypothetical protein
MGRTLLHGVNENKNKGKFLQQIKNTCRKAGVIPFERYTKRVIQKCTVNTFYT